MKKLILLTLICAMLLAVAVACDIPDEVISGSSSKRTLQSTDETKTFISDCSAHAPEDSLGHADTTGTTCSCPPETTTTSDAFDSTETLCEETGLLDTDLTSWTGDTVETTTCTETTMGTWDTGVGLEYVMTYTAAVITDGEEYKPYTSTVYFQNAMMVGDGVLMFVSMENQLPHWIEENVIPYVEINEKSDLKFTCHENGTIRHSGKFRLYVQNEDGSVTEVAELLESNLSEVYAYGTEHLTGKTVYISFPFLVRTGDYEAGTYAVHDIMCLIKTTF